MKNLFILLGLIVLFGACKKDEQLPELPIVEEPAKPRYSFKDQVVQGEFEGEPWKLISATAFYAHLGVDFDSSEFAYKVDLLSEQDSGNCTFYQPTKKYVSCKIPLKVGLYELLVPFGEVRLQGATFNNISKNGASANAGAINVLEIDTIKKVLIFDIDARCNEAYFINGRCTIPICN